jgi:hypothetical protein
MTLGRRYTKVSYECRVAPSCTERVAGGVQRLPPGAWTGLRRVASSGGFKTKTNEALTSQNVLSARSVATDLPLHHRQLHSSAVRLVDSLGCNGWPMAPNDCMVKDGER